MDSTMYFFSGSEVCLKWIPACAVTSTNCGTGRPLHFFDFAAGGGRGGIGCPLCAELVGRTAVMSRAARGNQRDHRATGSHETSRNEVTEFVPLESNVVF